MSAFVVHGLKNIVTQLALMMQNVKRLGDNRQFQQDMLLTVENALDRMRHMLLQLREGAKPAGPALGVQLAPIIRRIETMAHAKGRRLEVQIEACIPTRGHPERLERIIGHWVQNAFDATPPEGRVWIALDRLGDQARIKVGDTGRGMSAHFIQKRIFKAFQTTKPTGMGIGAYESLQYAQELGGRIEVGSEPGVDTNIQLLLPAFDHEQESGLKNLKYA
jgi:putative PEP-CTERM system histidine kinase